MTDWRTTPGSPQNCRRHRKERTTITTDIILTVINDEPNLYLAGASDGIVSLHIETSNEDVEIILTDKQLMELAFKCEIFMREKIDPTHQEEPT